MMLQRQRLVIRADANREIGYGHVMRCIALGQAWQDNNGSVTFLSRALPLSVSTRLQSEGFQIRQLEKLEPVAEARMIACEIESLQPCAVAADGYQFDEAWQATVTRTGIPLLVIDDYVHLKSYPANLVLNPNLHASEQMYRGRLAGQLLAGCQYALLRKEFLQIVGSPPHRLSGRNLQLLVTLGGYDPGGVTRRVIAGLEMLASSGLSVTVVSPIDGIVSRSPGITIVPFLNDMAKLMAECELAICAGGSTNWEMCLLGVPRLVVVLAENQRDIAASLQRAGCCRDLGWHADLSAAQISDQLRELIDDMPGRRAMATANRNVVDGRGAQRVCEVLANHLVAL